MGTYLAKIGMIRSPEGNKKVVALLLRFLKTMDVERKERAREKKLEWKRRND